MPRRAGFTLIELLVVIAVIATLAGLLIPATSMVQTKMKDVRCGNQLRQIGTATIAYKSDHDDRYPTSLRGMFSPEGGLQLHGLERILICPRDGMKGKSSSMNRGGPLEPALTELYDFEQSQGVGPMPISYLYQVSGMTLGPVINGDPPKWFYDDVGRPRPTTPVTWADGKKSEMMFGQPISSTQPNGAAWPADYFPVITCFWHNKWTISNCERDKKVQSVAWNGNIFWHIPFWASQVNPLVKLPSGQSYTP